MILWYNVLMNVRKQKLLLALLLSTTILVALVFVARTPVNLLGRILEGDELLRVQVESDFDRDGDIDFLDFTVFAAFYEEV